MFARDAAVRVINEHLVRTKPTLISEDGVEIRIHYMTLLSRIKSRTGDDKQWLMAPILDELRDAGWKCSIEGTHVNTKELIMIWGDLE